MTNRLDSYNLRLWELLQIGAKDGVLFTKNEIVRLDIKQFLDSGTPYIEYPNSYLFFKNKEVLASYSAEMLDVEDSIEKKNHSILGKYLSFPPKSIRAFSDGIPMDSKIYVDYQGISFVTHIDHIAEDLDWMTKHINIPTEYQTNIQLAINVREKEKSKFITLFLLKPGKKIPDYQAFVNRKEYILSKYKER